jgi:hypothetical protein
VDALILDTILRTIEESSEPEEKDLPTLLSLAKELNIPKLESLCKESIQRKQNEKSLTTNLNNLTLLSVKYYTWTEFKEHQNEQSFWVLIDGQVRCQRDSIGDHSGDSIGDSMTL